MINSIEQLMAMSEEDLLMERLEDGAGERCLFMPFIGEFGHEIMSHIRIVHWHQAAEKIVCCRPGNEVLYPSASQYVTDWDDLLVDRQRIGTMRSRRPDWAAVTSRFPGLRPVRAGRLSAEQEMIAINPTERIPFRPLPRGLKVDVVLGVRVRELFPERNWPHWQGVADVLRAAGISFAVIGHRGTSADVVGQQVHTGDLDTDAAIELLEGCKLYIGTDSGASHLAATVGARMLTFRETAAGARDLLPRMEQVNVGRVDVVEGGWDRPQRVSARALAMIGGL